MTLLDLLRRTDTGIAELGAFLDAQSPSDRAAAVLALGRSDQRTLWEKAAHAPAIDLDHFVRGAGPLQEVVHDGRNTLPLPPPLRRFQKRFCRPADGGGDRVLGYNEGPTRRLVGPGFFVAVATAGRPAWEARGAVVVDYFQVPREPVPPSWPHVVPNEQGVQRLVYAGTRDFMRRVSAHVSIGAAYKGERPLDHYFVLVRAGA